jgi:hypothetical protein
MSSIVTLEGIQKAVFFPFRGPKWGERFLIGAALCFANFILPIVPLIPLFGYFNRIMKRIIVEEQDPQLPEWSDWGALFLDGLRLLGVMIIYMLPALILVAAGYILFMGLYFSLIFSSVNLAQGFSSYNPFPVLASSVGMLSGVAVLMAGILLSYLTLVFVPPALGHTAARGSFAAAFQFKEWWPIFKTNLSGYVVALALTLGLYTIMYILAIFLYATVILCFLLPFALALIFFIWGLLGSSLFAIAYRDGTRRLAA